MVIWFMQKFGLIAIFLHIVMIHLSRKILMIIMIWLLIIVIENLFTTPFLYNQFVLYIIKYTLLCILYFL